MYLDVTERVLAALEAGTFADPEFMTDLDIRFANLSDRLRTTPRTPAGPPALGLEAAVRARGRKRGLLPIQFALAGMNAHIEHDLPVAVVATCKARRSVRRPTRRVREDYDRVNAVLASVEVEIRRSFLTHGGPAHRRRGRCGGGPGERLEHRQGPRPRLGQRRDALGGPRRRPARGPLPVEMLSHTVGMGSRILLTPVARGLDLVG